MMKFVKTPSTLAAVLVARYVSFLINLICFLFLIFCGGCLLFSGLFRCALLPVYKEDTNKSILNKSIR
jgi:cellulose synthase/poly-beta-1,6-N-acetylglucosamine synthase-like glycosyltransferase